MGKQTQAKDCKCIICGKQAVAFWPMCDPDIPSHPWCRECVDKKKQELYQKLSDITEEGRRQNNEK